MVPGEEVAPLVADLNQVIMQTLIRTQGFFF